MAEETEGPVAIEPAVAEAPAAVETETPVTETATEDPVSEGDAEETETEGKPKRESYNKLKRKNQYLQSEILRLSELASKPVSFNVRLKKLEAKFRSMSIDERKKLSKLGSLAAKFID